MKKLLGISVIAMLAVAPAFADPVGTGSTPSNDASATIINTNPPFAEVAANSDTDGNAASAGYVKGAYNAAIKAINKVNDKVNSELATSAGNGINKNNGAFSVKAATDGGIAVSEDGVSVDHGDTLEMSGTAGSKKLDVKIGNGIQKNGTSGAVEVKAKSNSGIAVDSNGVAVDYKSGGGLIIDATGDDAGKLKIATSGVDTAQLANGAVTTDKLGANAVTHAKLATDAVEAANIKNGEVTFVKMASGAVVTGGSTNNDKLTTQGYVDTAIGGLATDYAKKTNVVQTIKATTLTSTASNDFAVANGAVSGSVVIPIMNDWSNPDTASTTGLTSSSVSLALTSTTVNGGTVTTTINPASVIYNTVDCTDNTNASNAACLPQQGA